MPTYRKDRIGELLREEIADILEKRVTDPRIGLVTVGEVVVSADLRHARVYVSAMAPAAQRDELLAGLASAAPFIQTELAKRVRLRFHPRLTFRYDPTTERAARVQELLKSIEDEAVASQSEAPSAGEDAPAPGPEDLA